MNPPLFALPDKSDSFVNGFEAGMIFAKLITKPEILDTSDDFPLRRANIQVFRNMAKSLSYHVGFQKVKVGGKHKRYESEIDRDWIDAIFLERRK